MKDYTIPMTAKELASVHICLGNFYFTLVKQKKDNNKEFEASLSGFEAFLHSEAKKLKI